MHVSVDISSSDCVLSNAYIRNVRVGLRRQTLLSRNQLMRSDVSIDRTDRDYVNAERSAPPDRNTKSNA